MYCLHWVNVRAVYRLDQGNISVMYGLDCGSGSVIKLYRRVGVRVMAVDGTDCQGKV